MKIEKIENGTLGEKNSVFIAFYTEATHIYQTNEDCRNWKNNAWFCKVALLGYVIRWNGVSGFVGGQVDENETLLDAAKRECYEEVGYEVNVNDLKLFCSHNMKSSKTEQNTHLFICKVTPEEIYKIRKFSVESVHGQVESAGFVVAHMVLDTDKVLISNKWAGTAHEELKLLLESNIIEKANFENNEKDTTI